MLKNCLIVDDNNQQDILEQLVEKARKRGITLKCLQFNVGSEERSDLLNPDGRIDLQKVIESFKEEFAGTKLDLICVDYLLDDEYITGLDLLKEIYELRKTSQYMVYSSNLDAVAKGIIDNYDNDQDKKKLVSRIKLLTRYKIAEFSPRDRYDQAIIEVLSRNDQCLDLLLEEKLLEYPDLIFKNTYPVYEGRVLKDIALEIRKGTYHGEKFKREIIEQTIAQLIQINSR